MVLTVTDFRNSPSKALSCWNIRHITECLLITIHFFHTFLEIFYRAASPYFYSIVRLNPPTNNYTFHKKNAFYICIPVAECIKLLHFHILGWRKKEDTHVSYKLQQLTIKQFLSSLKSNLNSITTNTLPSNSIEFSRVYNHKRDLYRFCSIVDAHSEQTYRVFKSFICSLYWSKRIPKQLLLYGFRTS